MMPRNLDRRVEVLCPLQNPRCISRFSNNHGRQSEGYRAELAVVAGRVVNAYEGRERRRAFQPAQLFMTNPSLSGRGKSLKESSPRRLTRRSERQQSS
jgi:polyphosphate kinase